MKIEALAKGPIENVLNTNNIPFSIKYNGDVYKVIELDKQDLKRIRNCEIDLEDAWCMNSSGIGGSASYIITVNRDTMIGWQSKKDNYKKLTDYLEDLDVTDPEDVCHYAFGIAKANGVSLSKVFNTYEG